MKVGALLGDILGSLFKHPATEHYPSERKEAPERFRGELFWDPTKCSGCQLCTKDCPANAIELVVIDRASRRFVMRYHADRCIYCSQCVVNCRFKCLSMSNQQWELASRLSQPFTVNYGRDEDVQFLLEQETQASITGGS